LETTRTAGALSVGRPTVESHLRALEATHAVTLLRPFYGGGQKEIIKMPKVYVFDTGFIAFPGAGTPCAPMIMVCCGSTWYWSICKRTCMRQEFSIGAMRPEERSTL